MARHGNFIEIPFQLYAGLRAEVLIVGRSHAKNGQHGFHSCFSIFQIHHAQLLNIRREDEVPFGQKCRSFRQLRGAVIKHQSKGD
jgi:hypothetical protein